MSAVILTLFCPPKLSADNDGMCGAPARVPTCDRHCRPPSSISYRLRSRDQHVPEPRQPFPALITTSCQVWCRRTYPLQYYSVFATETLLFAVTLTFDLKHLHRIACDVVKLCTKFERVRTIIGGVIAI